MTYLEHQLEALCGIFDAAQAAIDDGHPEFVFGYCAIASMICGVEPKKAIDKERKLAESYGIPAYVVNNTVGIIAKIQPSVGRLIYNR